MSFVAVAIGTAVAGVGGAIINSNATRSAAAAQSDAANAANATQMSQYNQTRADQAPWRDSGAAALGQLNQQLPDLTRNFTMNDFQQDPGYAFRMQQGQQAIERSAAARGGLNSGATLKALDAYGQNQGAQEYQNAYNRFNNDQSNRFNKLSSVAGLGQTANNQINSAGMNATNNISQNTIGAANASGAAQVAGANSINNGIGQGMNTWMQSSMMNRMFPGGAQTGDMSIPPTNYNYGGLGVDLKLA